MKKFKKYLNRINNLGVRNNNNDKDFNNKYNRYGYSTFELVKYMENIYYNKYDEYINNGYKLSFGGEYLQKEYNTSINIKCFENKETSFVIGVFELNYGEPEALKIRLDCERYNDLSHNEKDTVNILIKESTKHIIKEINRLTKI
jgi:hypothetical protein